MNIAIKSEIDSRVLLYPLMRSLRSYGSILVISSNRQLRRLLDDDETGFRGYRIIVEESGATDDIYDEYGIAEGDFDFVILDNMGVIDYDLCFIPLGAKHTESFDDDVKLMLESESDKIMIVQFGKPSKNSHSTAATKPSPKRKGKDAEVEEDYDPAEKFRLTEEQKQKERVRGKVAMVPFPSYQDIENVESEYKFYEVNANLVNVFYEALKEELAVDKNQFQREVRKKDESSGYIKSRNSTREE